MLLRDIRNLKIASIDKILKTINPTINKQHLKKIIKKKNK